MRRLFSTLACMAAMFACFGASRLGAQPQAPSYEECRLDSIYPIGGRQGTSIKVTFKGFNGGLANPRGILIDGPTGITAKDLKPAAGNSIEATLDIAADAPLGRRRLRVLNEKSGLTNFAYFVVGSLPEQLEIEPNNDVAKPQPVEVPVVVDGRIDPAADLDVFRFRGRAGQKFVAAIAAHALDVHGQSKNYGIADFSLELLDAEGRTLAAAEDTIGFDPLVEHTFAADGDYFVRVQLLNYGGFPEAVYRLTLGDVPYVVGAFPAGVRRGAASEVELIGPNIAAGLKVLAASPSAPASKGAAPHSAYPLEFVTLQQSDRSGLDVPLIVGDLPEANETEPNDGRDSAKLLSLPITVNGRFATVGDADWYRVKLEAGRKITAEVHAQRFIRSPVDTLVQVFDSAGKLVEENDDEKFEPGYESYQDFKTTDSKLSFTATTAGDYYIRISDQAGASGPRAIYRLTLEDTRPDFRLTHFPDAVPIWGPGSTACVLVRADRFFGHNDDIEFSVVGLPAGWKAGTNTSLGTKPERPYNTHSLKVFLTITAPADAKPGIAVPFRIIGRVKRADGTVLERPSLPLSLFYTSDTGFFRASPTSRAAVAKPVGPWLETDVQELNIVQGESGAIGVRVRGIGVPKTMPLVVNLAGAGVACSLSTPQTLPVVDGKIEVPLKIARELAPGTYGIVVAQSWRSDIRIGMPGPCTPIIRLTVVAAK
jgi:hypothetical protein